VLPEAPGIDVRKQPELAARLLLRWCGEPART
jgi:hypothetical protein